VNEPDFIRHRTVFQIGVVPRHKDILSGLTGVSFPEAWEDRIAHKIGSCSVFFLGKRAFVKNIRALGRFKDLADLAAPAFRDQESD